MLRVKNKIGCILLDGKASSVSLLALKERCPTSVGDMDTHSPFLVREHSNNVWLVESFKGSGQGQELGLPLVKRHSVFYLSVTSALLPCERRGHFLCDAGCRWRQPLGILEPSSSRCTTN